MRKILAFFFFLGIASSVVAQQSPLVNRIYHSGANHELNIYGNAFQSSDAVPLSVAVRILTDEPISTSQRDNMAKNIGAKNRYEDWLKTGLFYEGFSKNDSLGQTGWYAGFEYVNERQIFFPEDAFNLIFYGNADFEDDTLFFPSLVYQDLAYNRLRGGFSQTINGLSGIFSFHAGISLYQGIGNTYLNFQNTSIYTAIDGEYLDITYDTRIEQANPGAKKIGDLKGLGAGIDLGFQYQRANHILHLDIQEVGFIRWYQDQSLYFGDSAIRYEGLIIDDLFGGTSSPLTSIDIDSLADALGLRIGEGDYGRNLPASFNLSYLNLPQSQGVFLGAGIRYRTVRGFIPEFSFSGGYRFRVGETGSTLLNARLAYGGLGGFQLGISNRWDFDHFFAVLEMRSILGFFAPEKIPGGALSISLGARF